MNWKRKLASRKFWALLAGIITSVLVIFVTEEAASQIAGIILQLGAIITYIWGEAKIDAVYAEKEEHEPEKEVKYGFGE